MDASVFMNYILGSVCYAAICYKTKQEIEKYFKNDPEFKNDSEFREIKFDETDAAKLSEYEGLLKDMLSY
jgi:hypothetical protein